VSLEGLLGTPPLKGIHAAEHLSRNTSLSILGACCRLAKPLYVSHLLKHIIKALPCLCCFDSSRDGYKVLIIGGGAAGITTASHYARKLPNHQVAVIEVCQQLKLSVSVALQQYVMSQTCPAARVT
jgi:uncharacterized radical SAM superfamily protein